MPDEENMCVAVPANNSKEGLSFVEQVAAGNLGALQRSLAPLTGHL
jgi:hypothetical protein